MVDLIAFLNARLDEDEARAKNHTCINCGRPTVPLRNALGITGYTHDDVGIGWAGQRCPGRLTGAEPVQDPACVLRDVAAKRRIVARCEKRLATQPARKIGVLSRLAYETLCDLASIDSDHPDYRQEWAS